MATSERKSLPIYQERARALLLKFGAKAAAEITILRQQQELLALHEEIDGSAETYVLEPGEYRDAIEILEGELAPSWEPGTDPIEAHEDWLARLEARIAAVEKTSADTETQASKLDGAAKDGLEGTAAAIVELAELKARVAALEKDLPQAEAALVRRELAFRTAVEEAIGKQGRVIREEARKAREATAIELERRIAAAEASLKALAQREGDVLQPLEDRVRSLEGEVRSVCGRLLPLEERERGRRK